MMQPSRMGAIIGPPGPGDGLNTSVTAAAAGDPEAIGRVLDWIEPLVVRYCRAHFGQWERSFDAADRLATDVCRTVLTVLPRYRGGPFAAFVYDVAARMVAARKLAEEPPRLEPGEFDALLARSSLGAPRAVAARLRSAEHDLDGQAIAMVTKILLETEQASQRPCDPAGQWISERLSRLPDFQREILVLRTVLGLSAEETAAAIGSTPGAVRVDQHRALEQLREVQMTPRMGFLVDVVGYGSRSTPAQEHLQTRLWSLVDNLLADIDVDTDATHDDGGSGDSMAVFLPVGTDPTRALPGLLTAAAERLAQDNRRYRDRIRIRMSVGFGLVGKGRLGFTGPLVVDLTRLNDSMPIRQAVLRHPQSDLVVLVSDALHTDVTRSGYLPTSLVFRRFEVEVKEFAAPAWLWVGPE